MTRILAFDFGASSGRAILAEYENEMLSYREVHRFENIPIEEDGHLAWNFSELMQNVNEGIKKAGQFDSVGFDTWGVDFGLLDADGGLLANPVHYRDNRTDGITEKAFEAISAKELYFETGNQIMQINTLFQLMTADLSKAKTMLFMPDLFAYMLCKKAVCETSIASTSQMLCPKTAQWSSRVLDALSIPKNIFAPLVKSGSVIGEYNGAKVIAVAGHDTQCAVAALPSNNEELAFLSCGTWSLLGTELDMPMLTENSLLNKLSNEIGANGKINYLKNIIGLWLIQESRRAWRRQGQEYSYAELERMALSATPLVSFIDPDSPELITPGDIPQRVQDICRRTNQIVPQTVGEIMRCIYESLALKYCFAIEQLQAVTGKSFTALHILGGGTKDRLLCQMTANATGLRVVAGPIEATALGNIAIQLIALNKIASVSEARKLIAKTEHLKVYEPCDEQAWQKSYLIYKKLLLEV